MDARTIRKQVREIDWKYFVREASRNAMEMIDARGSGEETLYSECGEELFETDENGRVTGAMGSAYMGSQLDAPSGKYYLPFACSNVEPCPRCHGSGQGKLIPCKYCDGFGVRTVWDLANIRKETIPQTRKFLQETRPENMIDDTAFRCWTCDGSGQTHKTCTLCDGLGSREAYEDQVWHEALDAMASRFGGSISYGEGDPLDMYFSVWVDVKRENAKQTVKRFVKREASYGELREAARDL